MSLPKVKGPAGTGQSPGPGSTSLEREEGWPSLRGLVPFHPSPSKLWPAERQGVRRLPKPSGPGRPWISRGRRWVTRGFQLRWAH